MKRLLLAAALASTSAPAFAAWTLVDFNGQASFHVDIDSMRRNDFGAAVTAMLNVPGSEGRRSNSVVVRYEILCKSNANRFRLKEVTQLNGPMGIGEPIMTSKEPGEWKPSRDDGTGRGVKTMVEWICNGAQLYVEPGSKKPSM